MCLVTERPAEEIMWLPQLISGKRRIILFVSRSNENSTISLAIM
jgi:hypothetical protein